MEHAVKRDWNITTWPHRDLLLPRTPGSGVPDLPVPDLMAWVRFAKGYALASNQIRQPGRWLYIDTRNAELEKAAAGLPEVWVDPIIYERSSDRLGGIEGCLSMPGLRLNVSRSHRILVKFSDLDGKAYDLGIEGLLARVVQHEVDHLDGKAIIDHVDHMRLTSSQDAALLKLRKRGGR